MSAVSDKIRESFKKSDDIRDAGLTTPDDVKRYDDICYGTDGNWQVMDVYRPENCEGKRLPVIISVHGGGWVYGDKERYQYYCMSLAQRGFAVVNYTYRLAPEFKFPAPLEDLNLVCGWIVQNAGEYDLDAEHVFAVGDSAGGHILGLYAAILTNPDYAKEYEFQAPEGFRLRAVGLNCAAYTVHRPEANQDTKELMNEYLPEKGSEKELFLTEVEKHVTSQYPPAFIMTAAADFLKAQAPIMVRKLTECEVPFIYRIYGDKNNQLGHVFHCDMRSKDAALCNDEECEFFAKFCRE